MGKSGDNIRDVLAVIPEHCYENPTWKGLLWSAWDIAVYCGVVAALIAVDSLWLIPLWILSGFAISAMFILGHDAAHRALFKSNRLNRIVAQILMLPAMHLHEGWVFGHNRLHHGHTVRQQMDFVWHPIAPSEYASLSCWRKFVHRVFWSPFGAGLYYGIDVWWKKMMTWTPPPKKRTAHRIQLGVVLLYTALFSAALLYGGFIREGSAVGALWMWFKVFFVPFVLWNYSIGLVVYLNHICPEIPWQKRQGWKPFQAQVEGTTVITVPPILNLFYHSIFFHVAHHVDTRIPFYNLRKASEAIREHYGDRTLEKKLSLLDYLRITRRCKLFDFERGVWLRYDEPAPEVVAEGLVSKTPEPAAV